MNSSFWYGVLVAISGFLGIHSTKIQLPIGLQHDFALIQKIQRHSINVSNNKQFKARVVAVADGDTIRVIDCHDNRRKIRLAYIDAPELSQAYGVASRDVLRQLIEAKEVDIIVFERDQYQRDVGQILLNGRDVNLWQIKNGYAWHYQTYAKRGQNKVSYIEYENAELNARQHRLGLWRDKKPQPPWLYRKQQKNLNNRY